ncbi:MAG: S-methyl-5'-thioadenosine phosphorylase [Kiritimatiellae bacterium]|nr:S-methyl-5'-thioadenosine phosphorylase [Kiritimatiellia bacterium]MDD5520411.1 S-methyl-5'-thioadenosine phosphorylase [Kiritimatiellia bacterium]
MKTGIIGGSGLYDMEGLTDVSKKVLQTPFGKPSDYYTCGKLGGYEVCFLPRHGHGHRFMPSEINYRANIFGFKILGVERIISVSAVGSLMEELSPGDIVLPDQYYDRTKNSAQHTFFGNGIVGHIAFSEPACSGLRRVIAACAKRVVKKNGKKPKVKVREGGTYVNIEGPAFSTKAESLVNRKLGFDVVGMTSLAEAKLCREAGICYQAMAMVTDYDCWHESKKPVSVEMVVAHLVANTILVKAIIRELIPIISRGKRTCGCQDALKDAIVTNKNMIPRKTKKALDLIIGKYL